MGHLNLGRHHRVASVLPQYHEHRHNILLARQAELDECRNTSIALGAVLFCTNSMFGKASWAAAHKPFIARPRHPIAGGFEPIATAFRVCPFLMRYYNKLLSKACCTSSTSS